MMHTSDKVVPLPRAALPPIRHGRVVSAQGRGAVIEIDGTQHDGQTAFSCLVQPLAGDRVLCSADAEGTHHVLAIVERPGEQHMALAFPGDASLLASHGSIGVVAGESVSLAAGGQLSCVAERALHRSREATLGFDEVTASGTRLHASFDTLRLFGKFISTMARHVTERFESYSRRSEAHDQVEARQMTRKAKGLYALDSTYTVMLSKKDTRIDGERIHMG